MNVTFITGNAKKAEYLAQYLDVPIAHRKIDLDEIQSLDLPPLVEHKARQANEMTQTPVLVEDVSLEFTALGRLPGPFIKWFLEDLSPQSLCDLLQDKDRSAVGKCGMGFYDGTTFTYFEGQLPGRIATQPAGEGGFGWDNIFIPDGYEITRAELRPEDYQNVYMQIRPLAQLKEFLQAYGR